jgi:hypothetical protein
MTSPLTPRPLSAKAFRVVAQGLRGKGWQILRGRMSEAVDPVAAATTRLEAAVERLSRAMAARPPASPVEGPASAEGSKPGVDQATVAALAERLDDTIARLRHVLGEDV